MTQSKYFGSIVHLLLLRNQLFLGDDGSNPYQSISFLIYFEKVPIHGAISTVIKSGTSLNEGSVTQRHQAFQEAKDYWFEVMQEHRH